MPELISNREYRRLKSRLTRAQNRARTLGTPEAYAAVIEECGYAYAIFDQYVWPDDWARWQSASRDAALAYIRVADRQPAEDFLRSHIVHIHIGDNLPR